MTYDLIIGDYAYSSWSLRGWLLLHRFGIPAKQHLVDFNAGSVRDQMPEFAPAKTVPTIRTPDGAIVSESLAIAEELASRHPEAGFWPSDPKARAIARNLTAEMASGFGALRGDCPMNMRAAYTSFVPSDAVKIDLRRLEEIWAHARSQPQITGPWLCGVYSAVDAFYAPVAARIAGYGLQVSTDAAAYVNAHLNDPAFRRWRAMGLVHGDDLEWYRRDYDRGAWPGPTPLGATACDGPSENASCPYSGDPVTHFLSLGNRVFGFCNAFCRDKTAADPEAWPTFMALL